ncbi:mediator of RNA polymerase II transcription subunit 2-like [Aristolochia californica]|uniref:mediator of RNA polymerase II transcription subunit 2-like n=1 Tax=Aristolochia californica TaxID=171875 RepID=UPI0035DB900D
MIRGHRLLVLCRGDALFTKWPLFQARAFCTAKAGQDERYRQLENLDMVTAAKILFDEPPKKKKFGLDFHLVQLFFACMPSLAVFLVAQYARYDSRRMKAEAEFKRLADEEKKAKEMEDIGEEEVEADSELSKVKERMDALEAALKEIADETKKLSETHITDKEELKTEQVGHSQSNCVNTTELTQTDAKGEEETNTEQVGPGDNNSRNKSDGSSTQAAESEYKSVSREE